MIFDSPEMIALREKYKDLANYEVPEVVFLDRYDGYEGEKQLLEDLLASVSSHKRKGWLGRLVSESAQQHIGAWFEIMLFGWLREHFIVQVEPELLGNFPDFIVTYQENPLIIEAKAYLVAKDERERQKRINRIWTSISSIQKSYIVKLRISKLGENIDINDLIEKVIHWIDSASDSEFDYRDNLSNILQMSATYSPGLKRIGIICSEGLWVNPDVLKTSLSEKATQHKALRKAGYPYVIAIFLESSHLSAEEVSEAWIGRPSVSLDLSTNKVVEEKLDQSGIHYFVKELRHTTVSGTLVFKAAYNSEQKTRYLQSWYVQNPHAKVWVSPAYFPAESRFIVVRQDTGIFELKWVK